MAIKIRCTECSKKISIDEAFAGGACRCPYCKAIVMVPGDGNESSGRPAEPRPDSPDAVVAQSAATVVEPESVPMADPVRIQSYVAVVVIGLLILTLIAGVAAFFVHRGGNKPVDEGPKKVEVPAPMVEGANPFDTKVIGPCVASDIKIATPVVYIIDCGHTMAQWVDMAVKMTRVSIRSLEPNQQFSVILAMKSSVVEPEGSESKPAGPKPTGPLPQGVMMLNGGLVSGGVAGEREAKKFIEGLQDSAGGVVDVAPAIKVALDLKPKVIVLFARKELEDAAPIIEAAKKAGVKVVTVALDASQDVQENLVKLSKATEAESRAYGNYQMDKWSNDFKDIGESDK